MRTPFSYNIPYRRWPADYQTGRDSFNQICPSFITQSTVTSEDQAATTAGTPTAPPLARTTTAIQNKYKSRVPNKVCLNFGVDQYRGRHLLAASNLSMQISRLPSPK